MLRIVFMGTPDFAVPTLSEIIGAGHDVIAVYTQPPRRAGRGMEETKGPVHRYAEAASIPVYTPKSLKSEAEQAIFTNHNADVAIVVAYGLILPQPILNAPREGCLNLHASKLPRWRGAAPIQRAIMAGDTETAASVMRMDAGLDTGPICLAEFVPIGPTTTAGELHDTLAKLGGSLMIRALAALQRGSLDATPQPTEGITYASKLNKAESRIDFNRAANDVHNQIRGLSPFPGAWFETTAGGKIERIKALKSEIAEGNGTPGEVLAPLSVSDAPKPEMPHEDALIIACLHGAVKLTAVQRAGKKPMTAEQLLRGFPLPPGTLLG